jgi:hypothetical protein
VRGLSFLGLVIALSAFAAPPAAPPATRAQIIVQSSPLAGFQFHEGKRLWGDMREGDRLTLTREPGNLHDAKAVRVEWQGHMLGYVPRAENVDVARMMDRGVKLDARITRLTDTRNPWGRIEFEVYVGD